MRIQKKILMLLIVVTSITAEAVTQGELLDAKMLASSADILRESKIKLEKVTQIMLDLEKKIAEQDKKKNANIDEVIKTSEVYYSNMLEILAEAQNTFLSCEPSDIRVLKNLREEILDIIADKQISKSNLERYNERKSLIEKGIAKLNKAYSDGLETIKISRKQLKQQGSRIKQNLTLAQWSDAGIQLDHIITQIKSLRSAIKNKLK